MIGMIAGLSAAAAAGQSARAAATVGVLIAVLVAVSVVDLRERRIPNSYTYPALVAAIVAAAAGGVDDALTAISGLVLGTLVMGAFYVVGRGRLGMGDVKLSGLLGAALGPTAVLPFLVVGSSAGAIAAAVLLIRGKGRAATFAYGPYLAAGGALVAVASGPIVN